MKQKQIYLIILFSCVVFSSCSNNSGKNQIPETTSSQAQSGDSGNGTGSSPVQNNNNNNSSGGTNVNAAQQLLDTSKLQSDMNDMLSSMAGKPDSNKLKYAASDILSTDAAILSDSGIDKLYGNSNDPAVKAARDALLKMRNTIGITPDKLDSIKKAAEALSKNGDHQP